MSGARRPHSRAEPGADSLVRFCAVLALLSGCSTKTTEPGSAAPVSGAAPSGPVNAGTSTDPGLAGDGHNLLKNADFDHGVSIPWTTSFTAPGDGSADIQNGELCVKVTNVGANAWDAQLRHREMVIQKGHSYRVSFKAHASVPTKLRPKVGMSGPPYAEYWSSTIDVGTSPAAYSGSFTMRASEDATAELAFHMGGRLAANAPFTVCFDDLHLDDPEFTAPPIVIAAPVPDVRVNQIGYAPAFPKRATVKSDSKEPVPWQILDASGAAVDKGTTTVFGNDPEAGESLAVADFSSFTKAGRGYVLAVGDQKSDPFDVRADAYKSLKIDALRYFYYTRSGVPIEMPYAKNEKWTHAAGHPGDKSVKCADEAGCNYSLDVSGGWYDAGDYGKYVVNGGIAVWTLLNQYERTKYLGATSADFGDGTLDIPESKNGVSDLLDDARFEIEFMLKMQVPDGQPHAGMVHHKIHDVKWTALGLPPSEAPVERRLRPVSTAATLNVAAVGAQCARIFRDVDAAFSKKCLAAAEKAWVAAQANPKMFAAKADAIGGGPYDDDHLDDEFFWAAAELFATTKKPEYGKFVEASPFYRMFPTNPDGSESRGAMTSLTWQDTAALGTISLAIVPNAVAPAEAQKFRAQIDAAADKFLALDAETGHHVPLTGGKSHRFRWGSNSLVLNNAIVLALAHDFTHDAKYLGGVVDAMDYILGRNPMGKSYVTGYGTNPLRHPHHRFWADQVNPKFPEPPPGIVSGGPNSSLQDPYSRAAGLVGCAPEKCYVDNIEAFSVNEVAINWNAPLAWVAAYLDEISEKPAREKK